MPDPRDAKSKPGHRFGTWSLCAVKLPGQLWLWCGSANALPDNACAWFGGGQRLQVIPSRQSGCRYLVLEAARV